MIRSVLAVFLVLLLATAIGGTGGVMAHSDVPATTDHTATATDVQTYAVTEEYRSISSQQFDETTFEITVHENGSATWTFRYERVLANTTEEDDFEAFAEEFEDDELDLYTNFVDQAEALTDTGSDETDREMEATSFNRSAGIEFHPGIPDDAIGVVEMTFLWTEFAVVDDEAETITVGDVFRGGLYIGQDQTIVVYPDDELVFVSAHPDGDYPTQSIEDASSITWVGEYEFDDNEPQIVLEHESAAMAQSTGNGSATIPGQTSSWLLVTALVIVGLSGALIWLRQRSPSATGDDPRRVDGTQDHALTDVGDGGIDGRTHAGHVVSEAELLTDEDRVVELIQRNGGRMKQVDIVDETGWSKSKVSMLLSEMESDGTISKLRVGRENIISLQGYEPEAMKSPFDE